MYRLIRERNLPIWLKWLLYILLTITCVYWIGYFTYKILEAIRWLIHSATEKKIFWVCLMLLTIATIVVLCLMQYEWGLDPFGQIAQKIVDVYKAIETDFLQKIKEGIENQMQ